MLYNERGWEDVANDLLRTCHINVRLESLSECDAGVFVALYEAILGEKVPDYIAEARSQEDDIHNVQSVVDSLALDYLQISLSHITGENIVRGDKESIRNLLEIFEGLLEYLTEQQSEDEELSDGGENRQHSERVLVAEPVEKDPDGASRASSTRSPGRSDRCSLASWNDSESTADLIRLGDTAHAFHTTTQQDVAEGDASPVLTLGEEPTLNGTTDVAQEPIISAMPLQPPYQMTPQRVLDRAAHSGSSSPQVQEPPSTIRDVHTENGNARRHNGLQSPAGPPSAVSSEKSSSMQGNDEMEQSSDQPSGSRRVLFRTRPDVLLLTRRNQLEGSSQENSQYLEDRVPTSSSGHRRFNQAEPRDRSVVVEELDEPLSRCSQRNRRAEQELHDMSEKLSRRLEELDLMLKRVLDDSGQTSQLKEEDKRSHHSDSVMECRRPKQQKDSPAASTPPRTQSLSSSPPPPRLSQPTQREEAHRPHRTLTQRWEPHTLPAQRKRDQVVQKAYEEELKRIEDEERAEMAKERLQVQGQEHEYREVLSREPPPRSNPARVCGTRPAPRIKRPTHSRKQTQPRKAAPLKVKENNLLPVLLEEFPPLPLSSHGLGSMWKQQMQQLDRLNAPDNRRGRIKLASEVEEAQRRHDLLVDIIRKEQEHNRRLRDFRERVQQQKSSQNRLREQRQQVARARKYHSDYHTQLRARLMKARTREERIFKQIFEEGLELQKARLREQRAYAKEQRQEHQRRHRDQLQAMENYYRDQFLLLAETLAQEREEIQVRKKVQEKALLKLKRDLRSRMEREIGELQRIIVQNDEDDYFCTLEAERLRSRMHAASFHYGTSCLP
ncbi:centrosomal protein of 95 kDa-like isoform X2 [Denticeps clupeoides]|uniref:DUF5745 domain-containing protein n=1 Tax=Denticeps clupeoides TaxID=299321 RepID=A0AAY4A716_9TELE|nr:centrosomal protein of 95 kDa isoform X2 [Denticeps clupeoides]